MKKKTLLFVVGFLETFALLLSWTGDIKAQAQDASISMAVEAAFGGTFKYGEWLPLWVQLENYGPDLDEAEVRVQVQSSGVAADYAVSLSLPTGARKRVPLYVLPNNFSQELQVLLLIEDEVLATEKVRVSPLPNIDYLVGMITPERGTLSLISSIEFPGRVRNKVLLELSVDDLPDRFEGLRSLNVLILNKIDTSELTPEQKDALESWVRQGGRLLIGGGSGARLTTAGLPDALLPLVPQGDQELDTLAGLEAFASDTPVRVPGPFIATTGSLNGGRVLASEGDLPLILERRLGDGFVDFVALDLTASPFNAWDGVTAFWENLLSPGAAYPDWLPPDLSARQQKYSQMFYALTNLPVLDLPTVRELALLLGVYILIIGPINYVLLRKWKQLHLAWVTIPVLTGLFTAAAFGIGYLRRGTNLVVNKIAIVEADPSGKAAITSFIGLFSPGQASYEVEVPGGGLLSPLNPYSDPWSSFSSPYSGSNLRFLQDNPPRVRGVSISQGSMQSFMTEGIWNDVAAVASDLRLVEENLVGSIQNQSPGNLSDAVLILNEAIIPIGSLSPGETRQLNEAVPNVGQQPFWGPPLSYQLLDEEGVWERGSSPPRDFELKRMVLDSVFEQGRGPTSPVVGYLSGGAGGQKLAVLLIGWLDAAPPEVRVAGTNPAEQTTALLIAPLSYELDVADGYSLPPGLLAGQLVESTGDVNWCGGTRSNTYYIRQGEAIFEFDIPTEALNTDVDILQLSIMSEMGRIAGLLVKVYDWDIGDWLQLAEPVEGVNVIPSPDSYISPDGTVRFLATGTGNFEGCVALSLGMEGSG